jgi:hypothetical protein
LQEKSRLDVESALRRSTFELSLSLAQTERENDMRFMVLVKASKESEAGVLPDEKMLAAMGNYNEELVKAGVMLAGDGLQPTSKGARVRFEGKKRTVIDGPFVESKELIAGYWIWQCKSREEAIDWLKRAPFDDGAEVEIRQIFELSDFGQSEAVEHHRKLQDQIARK